MTGPRVIVQLEDPALDSCDREIRDAIAATAKRFGAAGHSVQTAASPESWAALFERQVRVMQYEAGRIYRAALDLPDGQIGPQAARDARHRPGVVRDDLPPGSPISRRRPRPLLDDVCRCRHNSVSGGAQTAPAGLASTGDPRYISPWTALGGPIVTQPIGFHSNRLPIGMLLCSRPGSDLALARIACALSML
ncbi:MAG: hypothetical protein WDO24_19800 [Pseudomonadota bacterium]